MTEGDTRPYKGGWIGLDWEVGADSRCENAVGRGRLRSVGLYREAPWPTWCLVDFLGSDAW